MTSALPLRWVLLMFFLAVIHQASSGYFSVKVESPVSGLLGSSVSLPCDVTNNMDVRPLEVRWYRPNMVDTPALFYKDTQIQKSPVDVQYQGRVFLLGDLEKGDVSVKLENLTLTDRGDYVCYVKSATWYDKATVTLKLRVVGSTPVLSIREAGEGKVNVSCQSHGWLPEPSITWTDKDGRDLKHLSNDKFTNNSVGTVDVSSWLIVSPSESEWISCSVGLSDQERKEGRIMLHVPAHNTESLTGYIIIIIPVLLVLCVVGIAVYYVLRKKGLILSRRKGTESTGAGTQSETEPLNKTSVENPDQTDAPSTGSVPHAVVVDIDHNSEQSAKIPPTAPPTEPEVKSSEDKNQQEQDKPETTDTTTVCVRSEVSQQESSEHQNPETLEDKTHLTETGPADSTSDTTGAGTQSETEPLNKTRVENQDQTHAPSTGSVPHAVVVDIDHNSEQNAKIPPTAPPTDTNQTPETDETSRLTPETQTQTSSPVNQTQQNQNEFLNTHITESAVPTVCVRSEVSQQESSEHQNPETLEDKTHLTDLDEVKQYKVNISIDPEETPESLIYEGNEVKSAAVYNHWDINKRYVKSFTLCKERFQAGKHYWEVKVGNKAVKFSWFVGVASDGAVKESSVPFTPQNEFWVLCYERGDKGVYIRDQTEPISLPDVNKYMTAVGVFLDCDTHTLSFYNINTHSHIYTFTNVDARTSLRPLISPGVRDVHPVWII